MGYRDKYELMRGKEFREWFEWFMRGMQVSGTEEARALGFDAPERELAALAWGFYEKGREERDEA